MKTETVIAFIDQTTCRPFREAKDAPEGSTVFSSPEEMASAISRDAMDRITGRLLGEKTYKSATPLTAALRLWHTLHIGWDLTLRMRRGGFQKALSEQKTQGRKPIEVIYLSYVPGGHFMVDLFVSKLPHQARLILKALIDDGRGIWTLEEFNRVAMTVADQLNTRQPPLKVITFYRCKMFSKQILKKISYVEFAIKPLYKDLSLD